MHCQRLVYGAAVGAVGLCLVVGCGGGGGGKDAPRLVFEQSATVPPSGGAVSDTVRGVKVIVPAASVTSATNVTLRVFDRQRGEAEPPGCEASANAVELDLDPSAFAANGTLQVELPMASGYDPSATTMFVETEGGVLVPMAANYVPTRGALVGSLTGSRLAALSASGRGAGRLLLHAFWATLTGQPLPASGSFAKVRTGGQWQQVGSTRMVGRVAVVIHGVFQEAGNMDELAVYLSGLAGGRTVLGQSYNQVWSYDYGKTGTIDDIGAEFARDVRAVMDEAAVIDVYAHSMGGLVARWAIEKEGLGERVRRLVTLGTPHDGVPLEPVKAVVLYAARGLGADVAKCVPALLNLVKGSSFLDTLNEGASPYTDRVAYFTVAGDGGEGYLPWDLPVGQATAIAYGGKANDGLVTEDSARWPGLSRKSASWAVSPSWGAGNPNPEAMPLDHAGLVTNRAVGVRQQIERWLGKTVQPAFWSELTWTTDLNDMDLHMVPVSGAGGSTEECYYRNATTAWGGTLDLDDVDGYGNEHISGATVAAGRYLVSVEYFGTNGLTGASTPYVSVATALGARAFQCPEALILEDDTWDVCYVDFPSGTITPIDTVWHPGDRSDAGRASRPPKSRQGARVRPGHRGQQ